MADEQVRIDLIANDQASAKIDHVADETGKLEKLSPEVAVTADTSKADADLRDVADTASRLEANDVVIAIRAQIDQLKAESKAAQAALDDVSDKADDTNRHLEKIGGEGGLKTRGNAIADLTGPLGDASSAASDFAGVFDGLGDIAGDVAGKVGLSAAAMETAIGGIGIVIAAAAAAWTFFKGQQEEAKKKTAEMVKTQEDLNKAIKEGNREAAATDFAKNYPDAIKKGQALGLSIKSIVDHVTGANDVLPQARDHLKALQDQYVLASQAWTQNPALPRPSNEDLIAYKNAVDALDGARSKYIELNGTLDANKSKHEAIADALGLTTEATKTNTTVTDKAKDATDRWAEATAEAKRKSDNARTSIDLNTLAIQKLKDGLSDESVILNFQDTLIGAQDKIKENGKLTQQQVIDVKNAIIDAGNTAGLTSVEINSEIDKVTPEDVNTAFYETQGLINQHDDLKMKATIQATIDATIKSHSGARFALGPDGSLIPVGNSSVVNVNMPAGSRGVDVVRQVGAQSRRNGRRYGQQVVR